MTGVLKNNCAPNNNKLFNIVIPVFGGGPPLEVMINSFLSQTSDNFHLTIVSDGPCPDISNQINKYGGCNNISYYELDERYNDWGHTPREFGIYTSNCKYTIMTGYDNYYVPKFIEYFESIANGSSRVGFIFCDFITHHDRGEGDYNGHIESRLESSWIDFGCFAAETELIKQVGLKSRNFAADWDLVNSLIPLLKQLKKDAIKINKVLYIHN
jgi:hypothetical protein